MANYKIPIAVDESLEFYQNNFKNLPSKSPIILKPGLFGISESIRIINHATLLDHSVIISSTFQTKSSYSPLYYLANFSNLKKALPLYHGLDTLKYLPDEQVNLSS
jgi:O-succinylbenzoate synthase